MSLTFASRYTTNSAARRWTTSKQKGCELSVREIALFPPILTEMMGFANHTVAMQTAEIPDGRRQGLEYEGLGDEHTFAIESGVIRVIQR